ncbi:Uncharacterized protein Rs2_04370 [Raphanus sativus]|nr:Uncharacterized protein Rs2_04370 [Raphanus sativus]
MVLMVTATQLCFGLPLDPPPYDFLLIKSLSLIAPPEPPDPLHAVYLFAPLQAKPSQEFTQTLVPKLACPKMVTKLNGGGAPLVSAGDTPYAYGRLFHVVYMSHCGGADWFCLRSYLDLTFPPPTTVLQLEEKLIGIFHLVNMVLMDMKFSIVFCLEQFCFPRFPLV